MLDAFNDWFVHLQSGFAYVTEGVYGWGPRVRALSHNEVALITLRSPAVLAVDATAQRAVDANVQQHLAPCLSARSALLALVWAGLAALASLIYYPSVFILYVARVAGRVPGDNSQKAPTPLPCTYSARHCCCGGAPAAVAASQPAVELATIGGEGQSGDGGDYEAGQASSVGDADKLQQKRQQQYVPWPARLALLVEVWVAAKMQA